MGMSPKLLRPRASGFDPRSISGLALWLDAADTSSLFQNSDGTVPATAAGDPVGYWRDKSGNNRHATQATGASRATLSAASLNAKPTISNNGTGSVSLATPSWAYTSANTALVVFRGNAINQGVYQRGNLNDQPRMAIQQSPLAVCATRGGTILTQTTSSISYTASQWVIAGTLFNTSLGQAYRDGVYGTATTDSQTFSGNYPIRLLSLPTNIYGLNGGIAEFIYYDRQLSAAEVLRVSRYLAAKWGITLAPQVSNADAQDWVNRVYANGGTVSAATASAVNTLCNDIDSTPGLRACFYRLNLFCGTGLAACLVPLYRGPSLGGTQYGNTTDTNSGPFVSGDYTERGAGAGLLGASGKYLNTGFPTNTLSDGDRHLAVYETVRSGATFDRFIGSESAASVSQVFLLGYGNSATVVNFGFGAFAASLNATSTSSASFWLGVNQSPGNGIIYRNGTQDVTGSTTASTPPASEIFVFAVNRASAAAATDFFGGRLGSYSIGLSMTASQASAYYTAMQAFQTALGRNV